MNLNVCLIALPEIVWRSWPQDRSLSELAKDALAMERLLAKGVDPRKQQARYVQMCRRLQSLAMLHIGIHGSDDFLSWQGLNAEVYLNLIERLQNLEEIGKVKPQSTFSSSPYIPRTSKFIGKSFYQPGDDVKAQWCLFQDVKKSCEKLQRGTISILAHKKAEFYQQAYQKDAAVIEVVTFK